MKTLMCINVLLTGIGLLALPIRSPVSAPTIAETSAAVGSTAPPFIATTTGASEHALDAPVVSFEPPPLIEVAQVSAAPPPAPELYTEPAPVKPVATYTQPKQPVYRNFSSCGPGGCGPGIFRGRIFGRRR